MKVSILLVESALISICPEEQSGNLRRRPAHLVTDRLQGYIGTALYDELIIDVAADEAVRQRPHGVAPSFTTNEQAVMLY